ncbi:hypothetical protein FQB35_09775 [Crassaminicella thermophila]|uniref:AntA/AntB antirepressor domain-containing protein n=1 Tax=Crassaminicella thermophila TaxID=2599308 RepID=A0A5C0SE52_CRATE|nr:hypothetical protein FQB35_09775 [Crassaminicella thermophila]
MLLTLKLLWEQLGKPNGQFSKWANKRIKEVFKNGLEWSFSRIRIKDGRPKQVIKLTLETAKHVAMATGLDGNSSKKVREKGNLVRNYFYKKMEKKLLRDYEYWIMVREPQKEGYKKLSEVLDTNYQLTHEGKSAPNYVFSNEADMINRALLGMSAKKLQALLDTKDKATREHFTVEINKTISELQTMDMGLVMAGFDYETRKKTIANICSTKYKYMQLIVKELKKTA